MMMMCSSSDSVTAYQQRSRLLVISNLWACPWNQLLGCQLWVPDTIVGTRSSSLGQIKRVIGFSKKLPRQARVASLD